MARLLFILGVLATVFWVISIVDCALQPASRHRGVSKALWLVIVVLLPVGGGLLWFLIGRARPAHAQAAARGPLAPDDDPAFLRKLGSVADQNDRIRKLEEQLAELDRAEEGDDGDGSDDDQRDQRGAVG